MATRTGDDPLEDAKLAADGTGLGSKSGRKLAAAALDAARKLFPDGLPADSPYKAMSHDAILQEANRVGLDVAPLLRADELKLVLEAHRHGMKTAPVNSTPQGAQKMVAPPPVPPPPPPKRRLAALPPSATGLWRVKNQQNKTVSIGGTITVLSPGNVINANHYTDGELNGMVQQGVQFEAIAEDEL